MIESRRNFMSTILSMGLVLPYVDFLSVSDIHENLSFAHGWMATREILGSFPAKRPGISTRRNGKYTVFTDVETESDLFWSNNTAQMIWDHCTGDDGVDDMVAKITSAFDVAKDVCTRDVVMTLSIFRRKGLIVL